MLDEAFSANLVWSLTLIPAGRIVGAWRRPWPADAAAQAAEAPESGPGVALRPTTIAVILGGRFVRMGRVS